jgi:hypothetical protein
LFTDANEAAECGTVVAILAFASLVGVLWVGGLLGLGEALVLLEEISACTGVPTDDPDDLSFPARALSFRVSLGSA